ncbi:peptidoglycan binding domain protein [Oceanicola granulosus HTCC2516]|uniref:Peptidoglycan binding domain protein n=2 Tax=Oceanicola granulosus TaxID=252302 RepID=Q2CBE8_OCEGH|nr:peptidoglycan binding domain protein [Oceanicola granulosus HTCC2516]
MMWPMSAAAQETVWVQLEAQRTLSGAQTAARGYSNRLENVAGFAIGGGFYAIALGPYTPDDAGIVVRQLKSERAIPADAYLVDGGNFRQQFWPVGTGAPTVAQPLPTRYGGPGGSTGETDAAEVAETPLPEDVAAIPEESLSEARQSEAALSRDEKMMLQVALEWAGHYDAAIDGLFGGGTRNAMSSWQAEKGYQRTGVLTTRQRAELVSDYNAILEGLDLQVVRDEETGIQMQIPTGAVAFERYDPPFAMFEPTDPATLPARVILISQRGDEDRFFGLYEILQTLEIVPPEGERSRSAREFRIDAVGDDFRTYVQASLEGGEIKGFMLVWPAGDEDRRTRVLANMRGSFARIDGVLDPAIAPPDESQSVNMVSGLELREPRLTRSGFYIDARGSVLTTLDATEGCSDILVEDRYGAEIAHTDAELGLAVLRPESALAPRRVAEFQSNVPRLKSEVAVAGYPYGGLLAAPAVTFGTLADIRGLAGEDQLNRLDLAAQPGDAGGPLLDAGGTVLGMLKPRDDNGSTVLPSGVSFAVDSDTIVASLREGGFAVSTTDRLERLPAETLTLRAADLTVLVSCW